MNSKALPAILSYTDFFFEKTPDLDNRWGGYWGFSRVLNGFYFYFVGSSEDAELTFMNDVKAWKNSLSRDLQSLITVQMTQHDSYYNARNMDSSKPETDETGQDNLIISNRIVSKDWVKNNKAKAIEYFGKTYALGHLFNYFFGGATNEVNATDTAINPAYRTCTYQIETFTDAARDYLAEKLPNSESFGSGLNHASRTEPDWENSFWGSNLQRLKEIKAMVDPEGRFNCWHCIGWNSPT